MTQDELTRFVSDGFENAKRGNAISTYQAVLPYYKSGALQLKSHYPFGFIIYYALHQSRSHEIAERKIMLADYLSLQLTKPHKLHSMILVEAIRLYKDSKETAYNKRGEKATGFSLVNFCRLWNLDNLRPGDWRRKEFEGKPLSSTVEKLITSYVNELEDTRTSPSQAFLGIIDKALADYPDTPTLLMQRASLYELGGELEKSRLLLRNALLGATGKFYLWSRLARLIDPKENVHLHVALLYKALAAPGQSQFKGRVRLALANAWITRGMPAQALWELNMVKKIYAENDWHLPRIYTELSGRIPGGTVMQNPSELYKKVEHLADDEVFAALPEVRVVKTYHKDPVVSGAGRTGFGHPVVAWRVTDSAGHNYWIKPHRHGIAPDLPNGTALLIRLHGERPVKARLAPAAEEAK